MSKTPSLKSQQFRVTGMDCGSCASTVEVALQQLKGVTEVSVSFATEKVKLFYEPDLIGEQAIYDRITALGYKVETIPEAVSKAYSHTCSCDHEQHEHKHHAPNMAPRGATMDAKIAGMDCGSCAKTVEAGLRQLIGVHSVSVNFATERLQLSYDPQLVQEQTIHDRIKQLGYTVDQCFEHTQEKPKPTQKTATSWKFFLYNRRGQSVILAGIGLVLGLIAQNLPLSIWVARAFYGVGIIIAGYPVARAGLFELRLRRADMNLLMSISVIGAIILGDWFEAALVVFLFSLGSTLQLFSIGRTRNAIRALMDLTPTTATVKRNGREEKVNIESVQINEVITIRPGQRIALDGLVVFGSSAVDQSPITGESIPEDKEIGDTVYAGTMNQTGFLEVKVTHTANDTTVAKIIHLVEQAQESKAPSQQWVDKFAAIYTPIVILIALAIAFIPPLAFAQSFNVWVYRALVMLVIACPCSLVISTPVSIVSAIGAATRNGVLFKGGHALETAGRLQTLAFDKTGTITRGLPLVQKIYNTDKISAEMVLLIAASLEVQSEHPLFKSNSYRSKKSRDGLSGA